MQLFLFGLKYVQLIFEDEKMAHPGGRPTIYCEEIVDKVCDAISSHAMGYGEIYKRYDDLPCEATIQRWIGKHAEFRERYLKAKAVQAHILLDKTIDIANDDDEDTLIKINRAKLKIDTYKFNAVRLNPKDYGDKLEKSVNAEGLSLLANVIDKL